jgi:SAM-dependent methyltransferase
MRRHLPMGKSREECRSCKHRELHEVISLGFTPLANGLLAARDLAAPEKTYPLDLVFCPRCTLVQITETVSPEKLYREYFYLSSFSDALLQHARDLATCVMQRRLLNERSLVLEVASNDGYLLQYYERAGIPVLGVEPARKIARVAEVKHGIPTICEFFDEQLATRLSAQGRSADVIHANNVLAHVADLNGFVRGLRLVLKDDGLLIVEVPYVKDMIDRCEFDTIYHEHLCYFSLTALDDLFKRHGMVIHDVERLPIHGGTLRIYVSQERARDVVGGRFAVVAELLREEEAWGVADPGFYSTFREKVKSLGQALVTLLRDLKAEGRRIAGYGASAKGSTLLNCFRLGRETIEYVVDRSTVKQGFYTPGTHLRIFPPEKLLEDLPDYTLLLTWNFADEILEQQSEYRRRGGKFIIPIPESKII